MSLTFMLMDGEQRGATVVITNEDLALLLGGNALVMPGASVGCPELVSLSVSYIPEARELPGMALAAQEIIERCNAKVREQSAEGAPAPSVSVETLRAMHNRRDN